MASSKSGMRPALERKLQEFLNRSKEFNAFRNLDHEYLKAAFRAGAGSIVSSRFKNWEEAFNHWRKEFAKEEQEKYKRERTQAPSI